MLTKQGCWNLCFFSPEFAFLTNWFLVLRRYSGFELSFLSAMLSGTMFPTRRTRVSHDLICTIPCGWARNRGRKSVWKEERELCNICTMYNYCLILLAAAVAAKSNQLIFLPPTFPGLLRFYFFFLPSLPPLPRRERERESDDQFLSLPFQLITRSF